VAFLLFLFAVGLVIAGIVMLVAYAALMAVLVVAGVIWFVWAALFAAILSVMLGNSFDAAVYGGILAIPAAFATFAWYGKWRESEGGG
jgi:hypothetical protein